MRNKLSEDGKRWETLKNIEIRWEKIGIGSRNERLVKSCPLYKSPQKVGIGSFIKAFWRRRTYIFHSNIFEKRSSPLLSVDTHIKYTNCQRQI